MDKKRFLLNKKGSLTRSIDSFFLSASVFLLTWFLEFPILLNYRVNVFPTIEHHQPQNCSVS
jgi:hypothetical protein